MDFVQVTLCAFFVLCGIQGTLAISCLSCGTNGQQKLYMCNELIECQQNEACYIELSLPADGGAPKFKAGCRDLKFCNIAQCTDDAYGKTDSGRIQATGKRQSDEGDLVICSECCYKDYCNVKGCGETLVEDVTKGQRCFGCKGISGNVTCLEMVTCSSTEQCSSSIGRHGHTYDLGCEDKKLCSLLALAHGAQSSCCNETLCNSNPEVNRSIDIVDNTHTCPPKIIRPPTTRRSPTTVPTTPKTTPTVPTPPPTTPTVPTPPPTTPTVPTPPPTTPTVPTPPPTTPTVPTTPPTTPTVPTPPPTTPTVPTPPPTTPTVPTPPPTTPTVPTPPPTTPTVPTPPPTTPTVPTPPPTTPTVPTPPPTTPTVPTPPPTTPTIPTTPAPVTEEQPYRLPDVPTQCKVCDGPPDLCEILYKDATCQPPNNYCINHIDNSPDGSRTMNRTCGNFDTCFREWFQGTSDDDKCGLLSDTNFPHLSLTCTFCCIKDNCNEPIKPAENTLYSKKVIP